MGHHSLTKLDRLKARAQALLAEEEHVPLEEERSSRFGSFAYFCARVARSFVRNRCPVRAAALAYTTVLALVPVLGVAISVSAGLLKKESGQIQEWLKVGIEKVAPTLGYSAGTGQNTALDEAVKNLLEYVNNFQTGGLTVTAVIALIFVAISLLGSIESTFNDMWGATQGRSWSTRVVQYWAVLTLGPILLLAAAGVTTSSQLHWFKDLMERLAGEHHLNFFAHLLNFATSYFLPFLILSATLMALYLLLPNTKVQWRAALVGGLVAGALVQLNSTFNVFYASRVARDRSIYGGLAAVPLFLVGLYLSWLIVLLGAQVAYAFQNRRAYLQEKQAESVSQRGREFIALRLMTFIGQRFQTRTKPPTALEMAENLGVPLRLAGQLLALLMQSGLVIEATGPRAAEAIQALLSVLQRNYDEEQEPAR